MPRYTASAKQKVVSRLIDRIKHVRGGAAVGRFAAELYRHASPEDVLTLSEDALHGAALSAWSQLKAPRQPGEINLRVFNPADDGFGLGYTVVEIVNDDMPFLVASVTAELNRTGITVHRSLHPIVYVRRNAKGAIADVFEAAAVPTNATAESVMQLHIDHHSRADAREALEQRLRSVLCDVRDAVNDWPAMRKKVVDVITDVESARLPVSNDEIAETLAFLRWMESDHFTFLGYRDYRIVRDDGERAHIEIDARSGLGLLRKSSVMAFEGLTDLPELPPAVASYLQRPELLFVGKANRRSTVQRNTHMDTVAVRRFDTEGRVVGGRLFAGLFTSTVFASATREIPVLRKKVAAVIAASGFEPKSHDGRGLLHVLETLPRVQLFQFDEKTLLETCLGILRLRERQRVALFAHPDHLGRWVFCLVYVPRDRFDTRLRQRMAAILADGLRGTIDSFETSLSDEPLARVLYTVRIVPGDEPPHSIDEIERRLAAAARDWREDLLDGLIERHGSEIGRELFHDYGDAFPITYRDRYGAADAVADIDHLASAIATGAIVYNLYRVAEARPGEVRMRLYRRDQPQPLSDVLPVLENMGLRVIDEIPHRIAPAETEHVVWVHDFGLQTRTVTDVDLAAVKELFEEAMRGVCRGETESDGFNALVLAAGLSSRRVAVLRAYCKFLLQTGIPFSQSYMEGTLVKHAPIARAIVEMFENLFDPSLRDDTSRDAVAQRLQSQLDRALEEVKSLDEDRILRRFADAVSATLRTNYFQKPGDTAERDYIAFKLDSRALDGLPAPRPLVEIFVYSPRFEAVHLRGGRIARGGIRWSDRREDFRTEILGLMKAQTTKNAVIVPVGAKGGFVLKRPPSEGGREAMQREGIECYRAMMRALLDLTDNLVERKVVPPRDVVRRDGDDPYLVVAADKGTATFSDIANEIAAERNFWLGDAFASGGSAGYDHKAMGITARGAWESIKRHFREIGIDAMTTDFTSVGVGDMSGDVFGNGALYTPHMRLVAAFNHLHIFIDPTPDAAASYRERKRLFTLPRSSWADYDPKVISRGGGVFERTAKEIPVSAAMREMFDLGKKSTITPNELIRSILRAKVDLLFFGGIGTFVRAGSESHAEVGDRANDAVRIRGREIGARIVGEGANLAVTQRGRIEYALAGGRINTDFIDNSAGVDCSDHEVNIKIALAPAMAKGRLSRRKRDELLAAMTDEVAALVLRDNYRQSSALSEAERQSTVLLDDHARFLTALEKEGVLDRAVEFLPTAEEIDERRADGIGLTRPELAVLLAYAKIVLQEQVLDSDLPDDRHLAGGIGAYFPKPMRKRFAALLDEHPLRREITATYVANTIVNRMGPVFVSSVQDHTGAAAAGVARAYLAGRAMFRAAELWQEIDDLDDANAADLQTEMRLEVLALMKRATVWLLRHARRGAAVDDVVAAYEPAIEVVDANFDRLAPESTRQSRDQRVAHYTAKGAPPDLARRVASLDAIAAACDIGRIAAAHGVEVRGVATAYYQLGARLGIDWLRQASAGLVVEGDRWRKTAAIGLIDDLHSAQADLTSELIAAEKGEASRPERIEGWLRGRGHAFEHLESVVADLRSAPRLDLSMLSVAAADLRALGRAPRGDA